ncbi:MAG: hypothetical protein CL811_10570 [Colwelliaceae bacterium]|jgi:hypothetical protein|nr:hypothetical protein [Colwelliaceae bacterium]
MNCKRCRYELELIKERIQAIKYSLRWYSTDSQYCGLCEDKSNEVIVVYSWDKKKRTPTTEEKLDGIHEHYNQHHRLDTILTVPPRHKEFCK